MKAKAVAKYLRIGPRKVRVILGLIKSKNARQAQLILENINRKSARMLYSVLTSAIANAEQKKMNVDRLIVSDVRADEGPILKRIMPRAMGRADRINKRTSHISVELTEQVSENQPAEQKV